MAYVRTSRGRCLPRRCVNHPVYSVFDRRPRSPLGSRPFCCGSNMNVVLMSRWTVVFFGERRILPTVYLVCQLKGRGRSSLFECELPFDHKTLHLELEDKNFAGVMEGHQNEFKTTKSQEELVEESLANPYGSPSLEELCAGKKDIVIISSDHTRPVPSRVTMPILLHHIHSAAPEARVRILVATGMHRPSTHEELVI